jgi:hypothetical protein
MRHGRSIGAFVHDRHDSQMTPFVHDRHDTFIDWDALAIGLMLEFRFGAAGDICPTNTMRAGILLPIASKRHP